MWELYENINNNDWELIGTYDNLNYVNGVVAHELYLFGNEEIQFKIISKL